MSKNLFEIEDSMMNLLEYHVNDETGEIVETEEEFNELYDSILLDLNTKLDNTNCLQKMIDGEISVIDKEIKRLTAEKKARENKKEWLKNRVDFFIKKQFMNEDGEINTEELHKYKLELPHSKISYRKSDSVEITNFDLLPSMYIKKKVEESPDKVAIKDAIKNGKNVSGAKITTNYNIQIK